MRSVEQWMRSVEQWMRSVEQRLAALEQRVARLEARVETLERRVTALENEVRASAGTDRPPGATAGGTGVCGVRSGRPGALGNGVGPAKTGTPGPPVGGGRFPFPTFIGVSRHGASDRSLCGTDPAGLHRPARRCGGGTAGRPRPGRSGVSRRQHPDRYPGQRRPGARPFPAHLPGHGHAHFPHPVSSRDELPGNCASGPKRP